MSASRWSGWTSERGGSARTAVRSASATASTPTSSRCGRATSTARTASSTAPRSSSTPSRSGTARSTSRSTRRRAGPSSPRWTAPTAAGRRPSYDVLVDSPVEVGPHRPIRFEAGGVPHEVVVWGGTVGCEQARRGPRRRLRRRGGTVGRAADAALPLPALPGGQGPRRSRARRLHRAHLPPGADLHAQGLGGLPHPRLARVLPPLEREAAEAAGLRPLRLLGRELHPAALGLRGHHLVLRQSPRAPRRADERRRATSSASARRSRRSPRRRVDGCRRSRRPRSPPG